MKREWTNKELENAVLCYVDGGACYFTTRPLDKQWGDDWNDAPYEHNAGSPYEYSKHDEASGEDPWAVVAFRISGGVDTPCDISEHNSRWSVEQINKRQIPWLMPDYCSSDKPHPEMPIFAGTKLKDVCRVLREYGETVYLPEELCFLAKKGGQR